MGTSVLPLTLFFCIPYYSMIVDIKVDDDYYHNTILRVSVAMNISEMRSKLPTCNRKAKYCSENSAIQNIRLFNRSDIMSLYVSCEKFLQILHILYSRLERLGL
jgi:GTP1/Obg family GTP-binding protein